MMSSSCIPDVYVVELWLNGALMLGDFKLRSLFWWYRSFEYRNLTPVAISARAFFLSEFRVRQSLCSVKRALSLCFVGSFDRKGGFGGISCKMMGGGVTLVTRDVVCRAPGSAKNRTFLFGVFSRRSVMPVMPEAPHQASNTRFTVRFSFFS